MNTDNPERSSKKMSREKKFSETFKKLLPESPSGFNLPLDTFIKEAKSKYGGKHVDRAIRSYVFPNDWDSKAFTEKVSRRKFRLNRNEGLDLASFDHFTSYVLVTASSIVMKDPEDSLRGVIADALPELLAVVRPEERDAAYQKMSILNYERKRREEIIGAAAAIPSLDNRAVVPSTAAVRPNPPTNGMLPNTTGTVRTGVPVTANKPVATAAVAAPSILANPGSSIAPTLVNQATAKPATPIPNPVVRTTGFTNASAPANPGSAATSSRPSVPSAPVPVARTNATSSIKPGIPAIASTPAARPSAISASSPANRTVPSNAMAGMYPHPVSSGSVNSSTAVCSDIPANTGPGTATVPASQVAARPLVIQTQWSTPTTLPQANRVSVDLSELRRKLEMRRLNSTEPWMQKKVDLGPLKGISPASSGSQTIANPAPSQ